MPYRHTPAIRDFINRFLEATGRKDIKCDAILVDAFGDSPEMADRLLSLVLAGTKTASASSLWAWEHDHETPIEPGACSVILDGSGNPRCIVETTHADIVAYQDVTAEFARAEGEHEPLDLPDDRVFEHWRKGHWAFFGRTLTPLGRHPKQDMPVICERFKVIYQES